MNRLIVFPLFVLFLSGCAASWKEVGGPYNFEQMNYTVDLPAGWMKAPTTDMLLISRDGILLQNIIIKGMAIGDELEHSKKKIRADMLPHEQAELIADDFAINPSLLNFTIQENSPVTISGHKGFRLVFTYKNQGDLRVKSTVNGFMVRDQFYQICYTAAARYHYDRDLASYDQVVQSFKLYVNFL